MVDNCLYSEEVKNILDDMRFRLATCPSEKLVFSAYILFMENIGVK